MLENPLCCGTDSSDVFAFVSPSFARVFCVSSAGCCETPFHAVAPASAGGQAGATAPHRPCAGALVCKTQTLSLLLVQGTGTKGRCSRGDPVFGGAQLLR